MPSLITLTTDFGTGDPYVGLMKGVILGIAPHATVVDLSHDVPSQDILGGALVLQTVLGTFPCGAIHVAVVDPGVGTHRQAIAIETEHHLWVGPDNGIFTTVLEREPLCRAVVLNNPTFHRRPVSDTFHGRDIFAPVAAHLAAGTPIDALGEPTSQLVRLEEPKPRETVDGLELHVIRIDRFGNLILDITQDRFDRWVHADPGTVVHIRAGVSTIIGIGRTFADVPPGQLVAYFGSAGYLEVAVRNGSASARLGAAVGLTMYMSQPG